MKPPKTILSLVAVTLGTIGVLLGGFLFGLFLCDPHRTGPFEGPAPTMWIWFTPFVFLLWYGLRLSQRALYSFVITPVPVLLASGLYLALAGSGFGRWVFVLGIVAPIVSGLLVSAHYRRTKLTRR